MKKLFAIALLCVLIVQITIVSHYGAINAVAAEEEIEPDFAFAPEIDGYINKTAKEWENASKEEINLFSNKTTNPNDSGLPIRLWVLENDSNLYISVQFELENHSATEFVGLLISNDESEDTGDFLDAKIIQFSDLGGHDQDFSYKDYHISDNVFYKDDEKDGDGAAKLHDKETVYEFSIPMNTSVDEDEDVFLDFGEKYAFKIIYGEISSYPAGIKKSNIVLISIQYPKKPVPPPWENTLNILAVIIYSALGILFGYYIDKMVILKRKVDRLRG